MVKPGPSGADYPVPPELGRISDYPAHYARSDPDREALVLKNDRLSYGEFSERVDMCALALLAMGIGKGDRVATLSTPRPEVLITFLAAGRIGAVWLGLNPAYPLAEHQHVIRDSAPRIVFSVRADGKHDVLPDLAALRIMPDGPERIVIIGGGADLPSWGLPFEDFLAQAAALSEADLEASAALVEPRDAALIVYTSGTTGQPKGALLSHQALVRGSLLLHTHWQIEPLRILNNLPVNHIGGIGSISCFALVAGGTVVFMERFDAAGVPEIVEAERLSALIQVPAMLRLTCDGPGFRSRDTSSLQAVMWSGAPAPPDLVEQLAASGARLCSFYGMTEATGALSFTDPDADPETLAGTIGRPEPAYQFRIVDDSGAAVKPGQAGEIRVKTPNRMIGYLNRPGATADAFDGDGWLKTGDLAFEDEDGNYHLVGRLKEMFKSGGSNVFPREVEAVLEEHPAVLAAVVVGVPDPVFYEVGHGYLALDPGIKATEEHFQEFCGQRLAAYKVPKRFFFRDSLPLLPVGKVDRKALLGQSLAETKPDHSPKKSRP